jgi:hypothetical protein
MLCIAARGQAAIAPHPEPVNVVAVRLGRDDQLALAAAGTSIGFC